MPKSATAKMKTLPYSLLITLVSLLAASGSKAQTIDIKYVLLRMNQAVLNFDQGQYTFHYKSSSRSTDGDSSLNMHTSLCYLKMNRADSLIGYQLASFREDGYQQIYDGNQLLTVYDKTLEVIRKRDYPAKIKEQYEGFDGPVFLSGINRILHYYTNDSIAQKSLIASIETFAGEECYKVALKNPASSQNSRESYFYISMKSFLPVRFLTIAKSVIGKAQETSVLDYSITAILHKPVVADQFSREKLSDYVVEKNYNPADEEALDKLLAIGSVAPAWKLPLIAGGALQLSDLRGKIVIMDFWFKSCAPCRKQMTDLQKLHEKFNPSDVVIIGINTIDDPKKDNLNLFLQNRQITMPSVYKGNTIEKAYNVYGSPALFVIDRQGKILFAASGYSPSTLADVDTLVTKLVD